MDRAALYAMYKGDWAFAEGVEAVKWTPRGAAQITGIKGTRGELAKAQLRFFGQEFLDSGADTTMIIWVDTIAPATDVKPDKSTVEDADGNLYTIEYCKLVAYDTQWFLGLKAQV